MGSYLLLQVFGFHILGRFIVDAGKELVVPWQLLDGQVLYRDLFWIYGPWAPYFNALAYKTFGVHADVLLWIAKFLGAGVVWAVYRSVSRLTDSRTAFLAAASIVAFTTTSHYFAWPYSFSNLWATCLSLWAVDLFARWYGGGKTRLLVASAFCALIVVWSKFIIALPVLATLWLMVFFGRFSIGTSSAARQVRPLRPVVLYTMSVVGGFALSVWLFGRFTDPESYRLQLGAVFHARHLAAAGLYDRLREVVFLQNGSGAENISAAMAVLISPVAALFASFTWVFYWFRKPSVRQDLATALPYLAFGLGNLLQMNSSVHAPYVFPALIIPLFHATQLWRNHPPAGALRPAGTLIQAGTVAFCLLLGAGRMAKALDTERNVYVSTPRFEFRWARPNGPYIQAVANEIRATTSPEDRIVVFSSHDFLYLLSDRKPALGYFYTWYEPFHDARHAARVEAVLKSPEVKLVVTHLEDDFSLVFAGSPRSHPIYQTLRRHFDGTMDVTNRGGFVLWRKKPESAGADMGNR